MAKIAYVKYRPSETTAHILGLSNVVIEDFRGDGFDSVTLRQLYYKMVARDLFPEEWRDNEGNKNNPQSYGKFKSIIKKGRYGGFIDWEAIVDRTRKLNKNSHWESPSEIIRSCAEQFRLDSRKDQDIYIEIWVEKDAMVGVLESVCPGLDVPYYACRGNDSSSMVWRASMRFKEEEKRRAVLVLYLGDHDPSGMDMDRDIRDRLDLLGCKNTIVERIALNEAQIKQYKPPPFWAKVTDSRYEKYVEKYGDKAYELDALNPRQIVELIKQKVGGSTDRHKVELLLQEQDDCRGRLRKIARSLT